MTQQDTLIERYLAEVGHNLPAKLRLDVQRELRSALQDELDGRGLAAEAAGDQAAIAGLLQEFGAPEQIAARYQPDRQLIGPAAYPAFRLTFSIATVVITIVYLVGLGIQLYQGDFSLARFARFLAEYAQTLLFNFGVVAAAFALLDRFGWIKPASAQADWNPQRLPAVKDPDRVRRPELLSSLFFLLAAVVIVNFFPQWISMLRWDADGVQVTSLLGAGAAGYLVWLSVVWLLEAGLKVAVLRLGRWTRSLRVGELVLTLTSLAISVAILFSPDFFAEGLPQVIGRIALVVFAILAGLDVLEKAMRLVNQAVERRS